MSMRPLLCSIWNVWKPKWQFLKCCYEDPFELAMSLLNIIKWCVHRMGMFKFLQRKGVRWKLKDAYPCKWNIYTAVRLHTQFVHQWFYGYGELFEYEPGVLTSLLHSMLFWWNDADTPPPEDNWEAGLSGQYGKDHDPVETAMDCLHLFLHKCGYEEEYVKQQAEKLQNMQQAWDMILGIKGSQRIVTASTGTVANTNELLGIFGNCEMNFNLPHMCKAGMRCNCKRPNVVKDELLLDSGASDTFCNVKSLFTGNEEIDAPVSGFKGASRVKGRGTIEFGVHDDQGQPLQGP